MSETICGCCLHDPDNVNELLNSSSELKEQIDALTQIYKQLSLMCAANQVNRLEQSSEARARSNGDLFKRIKIIEDFIGQNYKVDIGFMHKRIDDIEECIDTKKIRDTIFAGAQTHASILKCDAKLKDIESKQKFLEANWERIQRLDNENDHHCEAITALERRFEIFEPLINKCLLGLSKIDDKVDNKSDKVDKDYHCCTNCT